jgi:hypothetical protein
MKSPFIVITLTFVIVMLVVSSIATSVFSAVVSSSLLSSNKIPSSSSSSSSPQAKIRFDTNTTIKDIVAIHNSGIPFDKYVAKISAAAKGQNATVSQIRAWNYVQSLVKINADVCNPDQQQQQQQGVNTRDPSNIIMSSFLLPPPPKAVCDSKISFVHEVCKGDPTIPDCSTTTSAKNYSLEAVNNYIKAKNLHDGTQTNNLAYEELENISITLNHTPSNNIAYVVHFGNSYSGASNS